MNAAGFPGLPLKTTPVGAATKQFAGVLSPVQATVPFGPGIVTTNPLFTPAPVYRVETPALLSLIHQGLVVLRDRPQGFFSCLSVKVAEKPEFGSVTRLVWT